MIPRYRPLNSEAGAAPAGSRHVTYVSLSRSVVEADLFSRLERALENYNAIKPTLDGITSTSSAESIGENPNTINTATEPQDSLPRTTWECAVCADEIPLASGFPTASVTSSCNHPPRTCLSCIQTQIRTNVDSDRRWDDVRCPECSAVMEYQDVKRLADRETFERYESRSVRAIISQDPDILECIAGCGYAQSHATGNAQPIVICRNCGARACFNHREKWHERMTCEEYDEYKRDPLNFKSRVEIEEEEAERQKERQEQRDLNLAQNMEANERARERQRREAENERRAKRQAAARKMQEEQASLDAIRAIAKPCPGCQRPIEKDSGCEHMTCSQCSHQFCWSCNAPWSNSHSFNCTRQPPR